MAVIGSYGAASIIAVPSSLRIKQINLEMNDTVAMSTSPWTGAQQTQWFPNDGWSGDITLPLMDITEIGAVEAFLSELRGMQNVFYLGHPLRKRPTGTVGSQSSPVTQGVQPAMNTTIGTHGWLKSAFRLLLPGDLIQLGYRLHRVLNSVSTDNNGYGAIDIWPIVREDIPNGTPLLLNKPQGLFRLAENKRSVTHTESRLGSITLKIQEAK